MFELMLGSITSKALGALWSKKVAANIPGDLSAAASATWKSDIYFAGGYNSITGETATLYRYSITTDSFVRLKDMPQALRLATAVMGDGKLYVWGGYNGTTYVSVFYVYTITTDTWATLAQPPVVADRPGSAGTMMTNIGTDIYLLGGSGGAVSGNGTGNFIKYVPSTNTWTKLATFPNAIVNGNIVAYNNKLYVTFGNFNNGAGIQREMQVYDPPTNTWTKLLDDTTTIDGIRVGSNASVFGNKIHYFGGGGSGTTSLIYSPEDNQLTKGGQVPLELRQGNRGGSLLRNKFYTLLNDTLWCYDPYYDKPKPDYVVIPFQEFYTASEFSSAFNVPGSSGSTMPDQGLNWLLIRYNNETWILPEKPIVRSSDFNSVKSYITGRTLSSNGYNYKLMGTVTPDDASTKQYGNLFGRVSATYTPVVSYGKMAKLSNITLGFVPASFEWTNKPSGSTEQVTIGGSGPAALVIPQFTTNAKCDLRPFIQVLSENFPW